MTKIIIDIPNCSKCPNFESTPYPTADSWERAENWWCGHTKWKGRDEEPGSGMRKPDYRKISGYVEWTDIKTERVPNWCPIKTKEKI